MSEVIKLGIKMAGVAILAATLFFLLGSIARRAQSTMENSFKVVMG